MLVSIMELQFNMSADDEKKMNVVIKYNKDDTFEADDGKRYKIPEYRYNMSEDTNKHALFPVERTCDTQCVLYRAVKKTPAGATKPTDLKSVECNWTKSDNHEHVESVGDRAMKAFYAVTLEKKDRTTNKKGKEQKHHNYGMEITSVKDLSGPAIELDLQKPGESKAMMNIAGKKCRVLSIVLDIDLPPKLPKCRCVVVYGEYRKDKTTVEIYRDVIKVSGADSSKLIAKY